MKSWSKILSISLCMMMVLTFFGCAAKEEAPATEPSAQASTEEPVEQTMAPNPLDGKTVTFWMQRYGSDPSAQEAAVNEIVAAFKAETGVTVNVSYVDWSQAYNKYSLACTGGEAPDAAEAFWTATFAKMGGDKYGPMVLNDVAEEFGMDNYYDGAIPEVKIGSDYYGLLWRGDTRTLVYNKAMFAEAGIAEPPKTWAELVDVATKLTNPDGSRYGVALFSNDGRFDQSWFTLLAASGGQVMNDDYTAPVFDSAASVESLQFMQDLVYKYKVMPPNTIDPSFNSPSEFFAEKVAMIIGAPGDMLAMASGNAPQMVEKMGRAVLPSKTGEGASSIAFAAPVWVFKTSQEPEAAKAWVKFFCMPENQIKLMKACGLISVNKTVMSDPYFQQDPWQVAAVEQLSRTIPGDPPFPQWGLVDAFPNGPLPNLCAEILAGKDVNETVAKYMAEVVKILAENP